MQFEGQNNEWNFYVISYYIIRYIQSVPIIDNIACS